MRKNDTGLKLCPSCNVFQDATKTECPNCCYDLTRVSTMKKEYLVGIRGWLLLPAIGLTLGPVVGGIKLLRMIELMDKMIERGFSNYWWFTMLVNLALLIFTCFVSVHFFKKRADTPILFIELMIAALIASVVLFIYTLALSQDSDALKVGMITPIVQGIGAAIWIPYFKKSRRVYVTFVK